MKKIKCGERSLMGSWGREYKFCKRHPGTTGEGERSLSAEGALPFWFLFVGALTAACGCLGNGAPRTEPPACWSPGAPSSPPSQAGGSRWLAGACQRSASCGSL